MRRRVLLFLCVFFCLAGPAGALAAPDAPETDPVGPLLTQLQAATDETEAEALQSAIILAWSRSRSPTASLLFDRALEAMDDSDMELSLELLGRVVELRPDFAQAWYQWAMVNYLMDDYETALSGLERALEVEPRHYMALVGLATILEAYDQKRSALAAVVKARAINPHIDDIEKWQKRLERDVLGQGI